MAGKKRVKVASPAKTSSKPSSKRHQGSIVDDRPKGAKEPMDMEGITEETKKPGSVLKKSQYTAVGSVPGATGKVSKKKPAPIGRISMADTAVTDDENPDDSPQRNRNTKDEDEDDDHFQTVSGKGKKKQSSLKKASTAARVSDIHESETQRIRTSQRVKDQIAKNLALRESNRFQSLSDNEDTEEQDGETEDEDDEGDDDDEIINLTNESEESNDDDDDDETVEDDVDQDGDTEMKEEDSVTETDDQQEDEYAILERRALAQYKGDSSKLSKDETEDLMMALLQQDEYEALYTRVIDAYEGEDTLDLTEDEINEMIRELAKKDKQAEQRKNKQRGKADKSSESAAKTDDGTGDNTTGKEANAASSGSKASSSKSEADATRNKPVNRRLSYSAAVRMADQSNPDRPNPERPAPQRRTMDASMPVRRINGKPYFDIRYPVWIFTPSSDTPLEEFSSEIKKILKLTHQVLGKSVGIAPWDDGYDGKIIWKESDVPSGGGLEDGRTFAHYFQSYINPRANSDKNKNFLKWRFVWPTTIKLLMDPERIGQELSSKFAQHEIHASMNWPYACQSPSFTTAGWLQWSTKEIDQKNFTIECKRMLKIPHEVAFGISWRTIKKMDGKPYEWDDDDKAPQALHVEVCDLYYPRVKAAIASLFKKNSSKRVNHTQLRLIPCFSNYIVQSYSKETRDGMVTMARKQQWFHNNVKKIPNSYIAALDIPDPDMPNHYTLRSFLMSQNIDNSYTTRILHNVDPMFRSDTMHVFTTIPEFTQYAQELIHRMIPETAHKHPNVYRQWFTPRALAAFEGCVWDSTTKQPIAKRNRELSSILTEDIWNVGDSWKSLVEQTKDTDKLAKEVEQEATAKGSKQGDEKDGKPAAKSSSAKGASVISNLPRSLQLMKDAEDVASYGDLLGRKRSDESIEADQPTTEPASKTIEIEGDVDLKSKSSDDDGNRSTSTAGLTTGTTRRDLKIMNEKNQEILAENKDMAERLQELQLERERAEEAQEEQNRRMELMQQQLTTLMNQQKEASAQAASTATEADGGGSEF